MTQLTPEASARELTELAWRRTLLRWVVVAVVAARIFTAVVGPVFVIVAFVTIAVAGALGIVASRSDVPDAVGKSAARLGVMVVGTLALGVAALIWLISQ